LRIFWGIRSIPSFQNLSDLSASRFQIIPRWWISGIWQRNQSE
jgi:hypothetical protein